MDSFSLTAGFPKLLAEYFQITSPQTDEYNCIAWAANDVERWWWPHPDAYWPDGLPTNNSVENFIEAFKTLGYEPCDGDHLEPGYLKVVIYVNSSGVTHMAKQLPNGHWSSKLGSDSDIEHQTPYGVEGETYGKVQCFLKKSSEA